MATNNLLFSVIASAAFFIPQLSSAQDNNSQVSPDDEPIKICQIISTSVYPNGEENVRFGAPHLTTESRVHKSITETKKIAGPGFSQQYVCQEAPKDLIQEFKKNVQACVEGVGQYQKLTKGVTDGQLLIPAQELYDGCHVLPESTRALTSQLIETITKEGLTSQGANLQM